MGERSEFEEALRRATAAITGPAIDAATRAARDAGRKGVADPVQTLDAFIQAVNASNGCGDPVDEHDDPEILWAFTVGLPVAALAVTVAAAATVAAGVWAAGRWAR